ncbi:hypothetical protein [Nocardia sp. NPDC049707]
MDTVSTSEVALVEIDNAVRTSAEELVAAAPSKKATERRNAAAL